MGLNWGQALENLGEGLGGLAKQKNIQADMAYREMAERNRQRFKSQEAQVQREFLSGEATTKREWEEPFKTRGLELQEQQVEISGDIRKSQLEMQGQQNVMSDYWKKLQMQQGEESLDIRRQTMEAAATGKELQEQRLNAKQRLEQFNDDMKRLKEEQKQVQGRLSNVFVGDEKPALESQMKSLKANQEAMESQKARDMQIIKLNDKQEVLYNEAFGAIGGGDDAATHAIAIKYAKMSEKNRALINSTAEKLMKDEPDTYKNWNHAQAKAINMLSGGRVELGKKKTTQVDKIKEASVKPAVMDVPEVRKSTGRRGERDVARQSLNLPDDMLKKKREILSMASSAAKSDGKMTEFLLSGSEYDQYIKAATEQWEKENTPDPGADFLAQTGGLSPIGGGAGSSL